MNLSFTIRKFCFMVCLTCMAISMANAQETYEVNSDLAQITGDIEPALQTQLFELSAEVFNKYASWADFWDKENDEFSNLKFSEMSALIDGTAKVFSDVDQQPTNIDMIEYTLKIFDNFQSLPVAFDVSDIYLIDLMWDENTGSYVSTIEFNKTVYNGIVDGTAMKLREPKDFPKLLMKIEFPAYDVTDYRIIGITGAVGRAIKVKKAKSDLAYISLEAMYGLGSVSASSQNTIGTNFGDLSSKLTTLGIGLQYRKPINIDEKLFLLFGLEGKQLKFDTDISTYGTGSSALDISAGTIERFSDLQNFLVDDFLNEEQVNVNGIAVVNDVNFSSSDSLGASNEVLKIMTFTAPIGIGLKISGQPYADMFFLDLLLTPSFSISSSGLTTANFSVSGFQVPDDPNFPTLEEIQATDASILDLPEYQLGDQSFSRNKSVETTSAFSLGIRVAPTYYKLIGFRYILSIGAYAEYMVISPVASNPVETEFLQPIIDENSEAASTSLLEKYFKVNTFNFGARVGLAYKFGG